MCTRLWRWDLRGIPIVYELAEEADEVLRTLAVKEQQRRAACELDDDREPLCASTPCDGRRTRSLPVEGGLIGCAAFRFTGP